MWWNVTKDGWNFIDEPKSAAGLLSESLPESIQLPVTSDEEFITLNSRLEEKAVSAALVNLIAWYNQSNWMKCNNDTVESR